MKLKNNLIAYIAEEHEAPLVTVTAFIRGGTASDENDGAAEAVERALRRGLKSAMAGLFAEKLQDMVAEYRVNVSQEMMELTFNVPAEHMGDALQLMAEVLRAPDIKAEDIEAIRATAGRVRRYGNGLGGARALYGDIILGNHAYSRTPAAVEAQRLTTTDVETFHRGFFVTRNVVLALSGDFVAEDARTALNAHFGDWKGGREPKMKQAAPVETAPGRQIHTYPLDTRQAWIAIGHEISPVSAGGAPSPGRDELHPWMQYGHHKGTDRYPARVRSVTKEDVLAAAYRYLLPGRIQMVIVGPIDRVREAKNTKGGRELEAFGRMIPVAETPSTE